MSTDAVGYDGTWDPLCVYQAVEWVDIEDGVPRWLDDMPPEERKKLVFWLEKQAELAWNEAVIAESRGFFAGGDRDEYLDRSPGDWLKTTPLLKRLAELAELDPPPPPPMVVEKATSIAEAGLAWFLQFVSVCVGRSPG